MFFVKANLNSRATTEMPGHLVCPGVPEGQEDKNFLKSSVPCGPEAVEVPVHILLTAESGPEEITPVNKGTCSVSASQKRRNLNL